VQNYYPRPKIQKWNDAGNPQVFAVKIWEDPCYGLLNIEKYAKLVF